MAKQRQNIVIVHPCGKEPGKPGGLFPVEAIRKPEGRYVHVPRMLPAVPHRIPDFGIIDGPDDLCL